MPRCRSCGGDAYRKLSLIHDSGDTTPSVKAAPPERRRASGYLVLLILLGIVLIATLSPGLIVVGALTIAACVWQYYAVRVYNRDQYPELYRKWDASYMCERCGSITLLGHAGSSLEPTEFKIIAPEKRPRSVRRLLGYGAGAQTRSRRP
ncbi:MAG: hypothetical protein ACREOK_07890 [Gemmatimonadaceae bacterium]